MCSLFVCLLAIIALAVALVIVVTKNSDDVNEPTVDLDLKQGEVDLKPVEMDVKPVEEAAILIVCKHQSLEIALNTKFDL